MLSCSSKDEQSNAVVDFEASKQDRNAFIEARKKREKWIASVHTPASSVRPMVQPSPFSMQQLVSNAGNSSISGNWRHSLFHNIVEEGLNLDKHVEESNIL